MGSEGGVVEKNPARTKNTQKCFQKIGGGDPIWGSVGLKKPKKKGDFRPKKSHISEIAMAGNRGGAKMLESELQNCISVSNKYYKVDLRRFRKIFKKGSEKFIFCEKKSQLVPCTIF